MTSAQKVIVKNWTFGGIFLVVLASVFLLPSEHRLAAGLATAALLVLMQLLNPEFRKWKGYGPKGLLLGEYVQEHGLLKLCMVGVCAFVLPVLIYRIYSSGGEAWGLYTLCFALLLGPAVVTSEIERYRSAGQNNVTTSGTRTR